MAINSNHLFEELNGIKCSIVEKEVTETRVSFLRELLQYNGFSVVVATSPPPKVVATVLKVENTSAEGSSEKESLQPTQALPQTFTIGVTNLMFNPTNAIFGRLLKTTRGNVVTLKYWEQLQVESADEIPYYENK